MKTKSERPETSAAARQVPAVSSGHLFKGILFGVIVVLSILATQISSRIVISQNWQRVTLTNMFADQLQDNAIFRARSLDPEARWLKTGEDVSPQIRSYIEENLASTIRMNGDELSKDSNLAWIIHYRGKEYTHNWKESYDQERGTLDYTIQGSSDGPVRYSGAIQPGSSFSRELSILVNPSIVPAERLNSTRGSEYNYELTLPEDFSIRYYIPSAIQPNGGTIAKTASGFDSRNILFCMAAGSGCLLLLLVLWRWETEKKLGVLGRFRRLKSLPALLLAGGGLYLLAVSVKTLCTMNADGTLALLLQSFGMSALQARGAASLSCFVLWGLFFGLVSLIILYTKSIVTEGFLRYLREDTITAALFTRAQQEMVESFSNPANSRTALKLLVTGFGIIIVFALLLLGGALLFEFQGMLLAFLFCLLLMALFVWGVYKKINASFAKVYAASEQLAKGNFSALKPEDVGFYQPLYDELINISESYQSALKEGLASQITKTQLISNVSHDLKTPVAGIQSYSELITLSDNMEDIHEYARRLSNYSLRLSDLIADLFDVAKATSGDITLKAIDLDLSELVMQVTAEWDDQFESKHLRPVYNLQPGTILHLDPGLTVRIMENLLSNICKYSLENSRVFVDLYAQDGLYQLILKNTSKTEMSFSPEQIVERFTRGDASRHESGSGLGLAIVKSFVEVQQGTFEVKTDGDLFKACISFAIPPKPDLPRPLPKPPVQSQPLKTGETPKTQGQVLLKADSGKPAQPGQSSRLLLPPSSQPVPAPLAEGLQEADQPAAIQPLAAEKKKEKEDELPPIVEAIHSPESGPENPLEKNDATFAAGPIETDPASEDPLFAASMKSASTAFDVLNAPSQSVLAGDDSAAPRAQPPAGEPAGSLRSGEDPVLTASIRAAHEPGEWFETLDPAPKEAPRLFLDQTSEIAQSIGIDSKSSEPENEESHPDLPQADKNDCVGQGA